MAPSLSGRSRSPLHDDIAAYYVNGFVFPKLQFCRRRARRMLLTSSSPFSRRLATIINKYRECKSERRRTLM